MLARKAKQKLAEDIACFYAELHATEPALLQAVGVLPLEPWPTPDVILKGIQPYLSKALLKKAEKTLDQWAQLADEPHGITSGFFDGPG